MIPSRRSLFSYPNLAFAANVSPHSQGQHFRLRHFEIATRLVSLMGAQRLPPLVEYSSQYFPPTERGNKYTLATEITQILPRKISTTVIFRLYPLFYQAMIYIASLSTTPSISFAVSPVALRVSSLPSAFTRLIYILLPRCPSLTLRQASSVCLGCITAQNKTCFVAEPHTLPFSMVSLQVQRRESRTDQAKKTYGESRLLVDS